MYDKYINVDENFQYSVNLQFDINNIEKIKNYIPTKDACDVLKFYFNSVLSPKNRATTLIGPYGKGKSHLLLVLLMLLSDYDKDDIKIINDLINKIKKVDDELYEMISNIRNNKIKLLPVIINSNYDDLNQAFLLGINDALEREKIDNIIVNTSFDAAISVLEDWQENHKEIISDIKECLKKEQYTIEKLKSNLKKYENDAYDVFQNVYECITHGQKFNPLINSDIVKNYKDISHVIGKNGFSGIFIAFDEFSKFLDSSDSKHIMRDLKILQDFAELANRTGSTEQIHLSCITHKAISEYLSDADEDKINSYKTVEGRFKNIYFNRSMEQNYEIISYALKKTKEFDTYFDKVLEKNAKFYLSIKEMSVFSDVENIEKVLFKGCFPLNPITAYSLIQLSEKIAQNERTLFTFLTDDDNNSLKSFIKNRSSNLFNIDKIYDYFEPILKNTNDNKIKDIWYKSTNILKKNLSENSNRIVKALAVIYMINETEELTPNIEILQHSLEMSENDVNKEVEELIDKSILRKKKITEELDFATMYSKQITNEVKELVNNQFSDIDEKSVISSVIGKFYTLPRRFNEQFKMTRYFSNVFISESELLNLSNFQILHNSELSDGIILNLIRTSKNIDEIIKHFKSIGDDRVVLKVSKLSFKKSFLNILKEYEAVSYLISNNTYSDEILVELEIMREELINAIKDAYKYYFSDENILSYIYMNDEVKRKNLSSILSSICENVYSKTPIINNELINKRDLSAPIKKAREIVVDSILENNKDLIKSKTSAEATIYKATVEKSDEPSIKNIIEIIKHFIQTSDNNKSSFSALYKELSSKPYSMRLGTIPILIALAINEYSENIILYYMNREIELNAENLIKINDNPDNYYILTEKGTVDRIEYISGLEKIYNVNISSDNIRKNVSELIDFMKKWIFGLPRIIRELNVEDAENNIDKEHLNFKAELLRPDINTNEFLFIRIPEIFRINDKEKLIQKIKEVKDNYDSYLSNYLEKLIIKTKNIIDSKYKGSLSTLLIEYNKQLNPDVRNNIYDIKTKNYIEFIADLKTHDEHDVIENLAKIFTSFYVEDWQYNQIEEYLNSFKETIEKINKPTVKNENSQKIVLMMGETTIEKNISEEENISALGETMKNNLEDIINEYGGSLSEEEKVSVLLSIMKKYM